MKCSVCQHDESMVVRTDASETEIVRRRQCAQCGHRWTTCERDRDALRRLDQVIEMARPLADLVKQA